jgi:hypothetical protein
MLIGALLALGLWFHAHDARIRKQAVVAERVKATEAARVHQDSIVATLQDSLRAARGHTNTLVVHAKAASATYAQQRAAVDVSAPQPDSVPAGMVVVPIAFVTAADSLSSQVERLTATIASERIASTARILAGDSANAILRAEVAQLRIAAEVGKIGTSDKIKYGAIGGGVMAAAILILGKN